MRCTFLSFQQNVFFLRQIFPGFLVTVFSSAGFSILVTRAVYQDIDFRPSPQFFKPILPSPSVLPTNIILLQVLFFLADFFPKS